MGFKVMGAVGAMDGKPLDEKHGLGDDERAAAVTKTKGQGAIVCRETEVCVGGTPKYNFK
jgi:hypothetical protein